MLRDKFKTPSANEAFKYTIVISILVGIMLFSIEMAGNVRYSWLIVGQDLADLKKENAKLKIKISQLEKKAEGYSELERQIANTLENLKKNNEQILSTESMLKNYDRDVLKPFVEKLKEYERRRVQID